MEPERTRAARALIGRCVGVLFFSGFGALWMFTSLHALGRLTRVSEALVGLAAGSLFGGAWWLSARMERVAGPEPTERSAEELATQRTFVRANVAQWVGIPIAVAALILLRRPEWIVPAIATIVGLHLLPLARAFRYNLHYVTGTVLILWSVGCVVLMPRAMVPGWGALGTAGILWTAATFTLLRAAVLGSRLERAELTGAGG